MNGRAILLTTLLLTATVAGFAWVTLTRWGTIGIYPALGQWVTGSALFAVTFAALFLLSRGRDPRAQQPRTPPAKDCGVPAASVEILSSGSAENQSHSR